MPSALENSFADASLLAYGLAMSGLLADYFLVGCRLLGLLVTLPGCNLSTVPWQLRCLLLVVMAGMITPNVSLSARPALRPAEPLSTQMAENSIRPVVHEDRISIDTREVDRSSSLSRSLRTTNSPASILALIGLAASELCLGALLGIGASLIVQGFRMAGQLIDQQTGLGLVAASGIDGEDGGSAMGELLFWVGNLLLIVLGGHLLLVSTLLETFRTFPPGCGGAPLDLLPVSSQLIQRSLSLALQLSAPVLAIQILVGLVIVHASSVAPQFQNVGTSSILRIAIALGVLTLALTGTTERLIELIPETQQMILQAIQATRGPG
ncbi:MAG: flagellar biosynthetic protein FliR [Planctomycetota bacterium]